MCGIKQARDKLMEWIRIGWITNTDHLAISGDFNNVLTVNDRLGGTSNIG